MITPSQCRAARGLLQWRQEDLANRAEVGVVTIRNFEKEKSATLKGSLLLIRNAFEAAGVEFVDDGGVSNSGGPGVRLRK